MNSDPRDWTTPDDGDERTPTGERTRGAELVKSELTGTEVTSLAETSSRAIAAQAEARIKARTLVALNRPRDMDTVRVRLLKECARPGFAAVARYHIPRGKGIEGPTIRFAEAAARYLGNLDVFAEVVFDDREKRVLQVTVVDLESNHAESLPVVVDKVMERRKLTKGQEPIGIRTNTSGETVYLVPVDETEMPMRQGAALAKARRNLILAHLPGDILEECQRAVVLTTRAEDKRDPDAARKAVADAFASIGVMPDALATYLGCALTAASPEQTVDLRAVFAAIRDGVTTWAAVMADKGGEGDGAAKGAVDELKAKLRAKMDRTTGKAADAPAAKEPDKPTAKVEPRTVCDVCFKWPHAPGCAAAPPSDDGGG